MNKDVAIPSPECCYLLLAKKLPLPSLIKVGMLLCSNFSFDDIGDIDERRQSLSSVKKLKKYIDDNAGVYGVRNARLALDYIIDGAASPPEIDSSIILILKPLRGGYSFARPELNGQITLRSDIARSLGHRACYCDLLWRKQKCAIEYTSKQYHEGYEKQARDEIRRSAIENMGYRVFFLTKTQLYSQAAFDGFVRLVRQHMGMRGQANTQKLSAARYSLRQELLYNASWILRRACRNQQGDR